MGGTATARCLDFSCGGLGGSIFLNVIVASISSPAKIVSSLNDTKTRTLEGSAALDMVLRRCREEASRGHRVFLGLGRFARLKCDNRAVGW